MARRKKHCKNVKHIKAITANPNCLPYGEITSMVFSNFSINKINNNLKIKRKNKQQNKTTYNKYEQKPTRS